MITGSLQIKNEKYHAVVYIPDETGRKKQKWISTGIKVAGNNKRQASQKLRERITHLEKQQISYSKETLFVDWISKWMEQKSSSLRQSTLEAYNINIEKHIMPYFKPLRLTLLKVTAQHIQGLLAKPLRQSKRINLLGLWMESY